MPGSLVAFALAALAHPVSAVDLTARVDLPVLVDGVGVPVTVTNLGHRPAHGVVRAAPIGPDGAPLAEPGPPVDVVLGGLSPDGTAPAVRVTVPLSDAGIAAIDHGVLAWVDAIEADVDRTNDPDVATCADARRRVDHDAITLRVPGRPTASRLRLAMVADPEITIVGLPDPGAQIRMPAGGDLAIAMVVALPPSDAAVIVRVEDAGAREAVAVGRWRWTTDRDGPVIDVAADGLVTGTVRDLGVGLGCDPVTLRVDGWEQRPVLTAADASTVAFTATLPAHATDVWIVARDAVGNESRVAVTPSPTLSEVP